MDQFFFVGNFEPNKRRFFGPNNRKYDPPGTLGPSLPRATPTHSRGMNMVSCGSGEQNNASGGRGSGSGAQVGHLVTYRDLLVGPYFTPVLPKSVKNGPKRGYPLFLTGFELAPPTLGGLHARRLEKVENVLHLSVFSGGQWPLLSSYSSIDPLGR